MEYLFFKKSIFLKQHIGNALLGRFLGTVCAREEGIGKKIPAF
jgi:hypothetical protein